MSNVSGIVPVLLDLSDPDARDRHRAALATLPAFFSVSCKAAGGVAVVSSATADWTERAAAQLSAGAAAVLLVIGEYLDEPGLDFLEQAAGAAGAVVAADLEYAADPAWEAVATSADPAEFGLIDGLATAEGSLRSAVIRLLVTLAVAIPVMPQFEALAQAPGLIALGSTSGSAPVTLTAVRGAHEVGQRLDLVGKHVRYEVRWPGRPGAAPTRHYTHTAAGSVRGTLAYEAAERTTWQRLHGHLGAAASPGSGLELLRAALTAAPALSLAASR